MASSSGVVSASAAAVVVVTRGHRTGGSHLAGLHRLDGVVTVSRCHWLWLFSGYPGGRARGLGVGVQNHPEKLVIVQIFWGAVATQPNRRGQPPWNRRPGNGPIACSLQWSLDVAKASDPKRPTQVQRPNLTGTLVGLAGSWHCFGGSS